MNRRDLLALGLAFLSARALTPRSALAQGKYPERPIKLMVAFSAGSGQFSNVPAFRNSLASKAATATTGSCSAEYSPKRRVGRQVWSDPGVI
jgi:hypothetical protein